MVAFADKNNQTGILELSSLYKHDNYDYVYDLRQKAEKALSEALGEKEYHVAGALKNAALEGLAGLGALATTIGMTEIGQNVTDYYNNIAENSPDVNEFRQAQAEGRESIWTEALGTSGPTAVAAGMSLIPYAGIPMAAAYFFHLNQDEVEQMALSKGADPATAKMTGYIGGAVNSALDMIPLSSYVIKNPFTKKLVDNFKHRLVGAGLKLMVDGGLEGLTEGTQQLVSEIFSEYAASKDTGEFLNKVNNPEWWDKVNKDIVKSATIGGIMGLGFGGVSAGASSMMDRTGAQPTPPPLNDQEKANLINIARQEFENGNITPDALNEIKNIHPDLSNDIDDIINSKIIDEINQTGDINVINKYSPAQASAEVFIDQLSGEDALRQSPQGADLLRGQLQQEQEESLLRKVKPEWFSPAQISAMAFEDQALRDDAAARSPQAREALFQKFANEERALGPAKDYGDNGYNITQVKDSENDKNTLWKIDIKPDFRMAIGGLIDEVQMGQPGGRIQVDQNEWIGYSSSYPTFMQNKGWTGNDVINALKKAQKGEVLGYRQASMVESAIDYLNELEYNALKEELLNEYSEEDIRRAEEEADSLINQQAQAFEVSPEELTALFEFKAGQDGIINDVPDLKTTGEAVEFSKIATPKQLEKAAQLSEKWGKEGQRLLAENKFNEAIAASTKSQLYREVGEAKAEPERFEIKKVIQKAQERKENIPTFKTYDEAQTAIDDYETKLMNEGKSDAEMDKDEYLKSLYESRNKIGQAELEQSYNEISTAVNAEVADKEFTDKILKNIYDIDPTSETGQYFAAQYTQRQVKNRANTREKILNAVKEDYGQKNNLDMDGVFSSMSGLSKPEQRELLKSLTDKAVKIETAVYEYFNGPEEKGGIEPWQETSVKEKVKAEEKESKPLASQETPKAEGEVVKITPKGTVLQVALPNANVNAYNMGSGDAFLTADGNIYLDGNIYSVGDSAYLYNKRFYKEPPKELKDNIEKNIDSHVEMLVKESEKIDRNALILERESDTILGKYKYKDYSLRYRNVTEFYGKKIDSITSKHDPQAIHDAIFDERLDKHRFEIGNYLHVTDDTKDLTPKQIEAVKNYQRQGGKLGETAEDALKGFPRAKKKKKEEADWQSKKEDESKQLQDYATSPVEKLTTEQFDAINRIIDLVSGKRSNVNIGNDPRIIGHNPMQEDGDLESFIIKKGYEILSKTEIPNIGTWSNNVIELKYKTPTDIRYAYLLNDQADVDMFGQESLISKEKLNKDDLEKLFKQSREVSEISSEKKQKELEALDKKLPPSFRSIVGPRGKNLQEFADDIYQNGLTLESIKKWKNTAWHDEWKEYIETGTNKYSFPYPLNVEVKSLLTWAYNLGIGKDGVTPHGSWSKLFPNQPSSPETGEKKYSIKDVKGKKAPIFYSALEQGISNLKQETATPEQWQGMINKLPIKQEELEWVGLADWLKEQKGKVTKSQILDFVRANNVQVVEIEKGKSLDKAKYVKEIESDIKEFGDYEFKSGKKLVPNEEGGIDYVEDLGYLIRSYGSISDAVGSLSGTEIHMDQNIGTKYSQYQLPGGENYKELLLTMPETPTLPDGWSVKQFTSGRNEGKWAIYTKDGYRLDDLYDNEKDAFNRGSKETIKQGGKGYKSSHWDEPNVLAHVRFNERTGANGEKILFIEEIQSDAHQEGRKRGYRDLTEKELTRLDELAQKDLLTQAESDEFGALSKRKIAPVPDMPFKKSWPLTAFKRMVRYAAENGYDSIAWTPGEVQADRYDLSKQVESITINKVGGQYSIIAKVPRRVGEGTREFNVADRMLDEKELDTYIGKDLAEKAKSQSEIKPVTYSGTDLKVGGEGMKGFYDKILPTEVGKFFNKPAWGNAKVGTMNLFTGGVMESRNYEDYVKGRNKKKTVEVWTIPITSEMREKALFEGMPMFSITHKQKQLFSQVGYNEIKHVFPGSKVAPLPSIEMPNKKGFLVTMPNGRKFILDPTLDKISVDTEAAAKEYKISKSQMESWLNSTGQVKGATSMINKTMGFIELINTAGPDTLTHEKLHMIIMMGGLSSANVDKIIKRYGTEEKAAEAFRRREGFTEGLWDKIKGWLDKLRSALFGDVFDAVDMAMQGEMQGEAQGGPSYQIKAKDRIDDAKYLELAKDPEKNREELKKMVDDAARRAGYDPSIEYRMQHQAPNSVSGIRLDKAMEDETVPKDYWERPDYYQYGDDEYSSFYKIKKAIELQKQYDAEGEGKKSRIWVYRAVPKNIKDENFRNGDWITPSREYAQSEGRNIPEGYKVIAKKVDITDVYWDVNSINEMGYDDGKNYAYKNTKNNRKLLDPVTYYAGEIVPLSKRFNFREYSPRYQIKDEHSGLLQDIKGKMDKVSNALSIGTWKNKKKDLRPITDVLLSTPLHSYDRIPTMGRLFDTANEKVDINNEVLDSLTRNPETDEVYTRIIELAKKNDPEMYKKWTDYRINQDKNQIGYKIRFNPETGNHDLYAPDELLAGEYDSYVKALKASMASDTPTWVVKTGDKYNLYKSQDKPVASYDSDAEALKYSRLFEAKEFMKKYGASEEMMKTFLAEKTMLDNGFNVQMQAMRDLIKYYKENDLPMPSTPVTMEGETVQVNLEMALAMMGDRRGYYFPRIRNQGQFMLSAKKGNKKWMDFYDMGAEITEDKSRGTLLKQVLNSVSPMGKDARELRNQGYEVTIEKAERTPEEVFVEQTRRIINLQTEINDALKAVKKGKVSFESLGFEVEKYKGKNKKGNDVEFLTLDGNTNKQQREMFKEFGGEYYAAQKGEKEAWHFRNPGKSFESRLLKALATVSNNVELETVNMFAQELIDSLATMEKGRGARSHMISRDTSRGDDVWEGYETDPLIAASKYVAGIAGSEAKKIMSGKLMRQFFGIDITWKEFKAAKSFEGSYGEFVEDQQKQGNKVVISETEYADINDPEGYIENQKELALLKEQIANAADGEDIAELVDKKQEAYDWLYSQYRDMVDERRIDSQEQTVAWKDGKSFIENMIRNDESVDRIMGFFKGLAVLKYLAGRVSAPIINLTALATSAPGAMNAFGDIPITTSLNLIQKYARKYGQYMLTKNGRDNMTEDEQWVFDQIKAKGWDSAAFNREALTALETKTGKAWRRMIELSMLGFGVTEQLNRASTIAGAYFGLMETKPDMSKTERLKLAKDISDKAHGVYNKSNMPAWARGSGIAGNLARSFYVFKTFSHNYLQTMAKAWGPGWTPEHAKAFSFMALAPAVLGGAGAIVGKEVIIQFAKALGLGGDDPEEEFYKFVADNFGETSEDVARFGLAGLAGINLKGSLEIGITDLPTTIQDFMGAPGSIVKDIYEGGVNISKGNIIKGLENIMPLAIANPIKGIREATEGLTTKANAPIFYGKKPIVADTVDALLRVFSFNPAELSEIREKQWSEKQIEQKYTERRAEIYSRARKYMLQPYEKRNESDWVEIIDQIQKYNDRLKESGYNYIPKITSKSLKNNLRRALRPSKKERMREMED